ncbi:hypothetical protein [Candidatus Uabimicrobium amorphum]|uniref:Uncharacterized protein n=1 Tax=Uabimicrobium amorphum TaxID=2596890 RepID=A0A5S9F5J5_UABAM|nr:hypothetical protein [Candidatus Uabimicrobium amorphum]BBM86678.1 hypothetical protein UABAM_05064 [Candidatus Uabimicrobium amorphum]
MSVFKILPSLDKEQKPSLIRNTLPQNSNQVFTMLFQNEQSIQRKQKKHIFELFSPNPQNNPIQQAHRSNAELHMQQRLAQYRNLLPHMAGEIGSGKILKGGHLISAIQNTHPGAEIEIAEEDQNGVCIGRWRIPGYAWKMSTFFPRGWSEDDLWRELAGSNQIGRSRVSKSGIPIVKKGDTFFPAFQREESAPQKGKKNRRGKKKK